MSASSIAEARNTRAVEHQATTRSATALDRRLRVMVQCHPVLRPEEHDALLRAHPSVETVLATTDDECERAAAQADGAVVFGWRPEDLITRAPRLRWLQLMTAGIDGLPRSVLDSSLVITATKGPMALPMAEHAVSLLLALARRLPTFLDSQRGGEWAGWRRRPSVLADIVQLTGKTVLVVGTGGVGGHVARICQQGFAMRVLGMARASRSHPHVDRYVERRDLYAALAEAHFVVLCAPHTPATHQMIDAVALAAMRSDAILVNVARGHLVDEAALAAALQFGTIAGAGLDTFEVEPLPSDSPLWACPNVLITPHIAPASDRAKAAMVEFWAEQIRRFAVGEPLQGLVDKVAGY